MDEAVWLASNDLVAMLKWLDTSSSLAKCPWSEWKTSDRKLRLFACACVLLESSKEDRADRYERRGMPGYSDWEWANAWLSLSETVTQSLKAAILRDIIGNPWRPVEFCEYWRHANHSAVFNIAMKIYKERCFDDLSILADALEDAGCDNADILAHCRGKCERCWGSGWHRYFPDLSGKPNWSDSAACSMCDGYGIARGQHIRGCWVIDLILGKE